MDQLSHIQQTAASQISREDGKADIVDIVAHFEHLLLNDARITRETLIDCMSIAITIISDYALITTPQTFAADLLQYVRTNFVDVFRSKANEFDPDSAALRALSTGFLNLYPEYVRYVFPEMNISFSITINEDGTSVEYV